MRIAFLRHLDTSSWALYPRWPEKPPDPIFRSRFESFRRTVEPHLGAAYNLAHWLTLNENSAEDIVEEAYVQAWRLFDRQKCGTKARFLAIVRDMSRNVHPPGERASAPMPVEQAPACNGAGGLDDQQPVCTQEKTADLRQSIARLPVDFREVLIMRELEQMSYREIAEATGQTVATVISRLSMAREGLQSATNLDYQETPIS